jgi:hypothetical protein
MGVVLVVAWGRHRPRGRGGVPGLSVGTAEAGPGVDWVSGAPNARWADECGAIGVVAFPAVAAA